MRNTLKLLGTNNVKTVKGEKYGYMTFIMYLAPNTMNIKGQNLCPMATKGCIKACINTAGMGKFSNVQKSRLNKSNYFVNDRQGFLNDLYKDIKNAETIASVNDMVPVFRLNGTSDIQWENIKVKDNKNIFELFPHLQFYDYTKIINRFEKKLPENYNLTFSYSKEEDYYKGKIDELTVNLLNKGINVSVVFRNELPKTYLGFPVINGDETDLRFSDANGVIIGLHAKGQGKKDNTGFVIDIK